MLIHTKFLLSLFLFRTETDKVIKDAESFTRYNKLSPAIGTIKLKTMT